MTRGETERYRRLLEIKETELATGLLRRDEIAIERTADQIDGMLLAQQRDVAVRHLDRDTVLYREVREALEHLRDGTYGVCSRCGEPIGVRRLEAVPWAGCCVACQEILDREGEQESTAPPRAADTPQALPPRLRRRLSRAA